MSKFTLPLKTRFIQRIGVYRIECYEGECGGHRHDFYNHSEAIEKEAFDGEYLCDKCGHAFEARTGYQLYNTESGRPEPGDVFWEDWLPENTYWDNHKGPHLMAVCPNGTRWNVDSRASNCELPDDKTHRCWVRHGKPEDGTLHVDKQGHTCKAGGGSIWVDKGTPNEYHGMLHNGQFT
jgi:hypothetical protein